MNKKTLLVTGATGKIGYAIAEKLAEDKNNKVVLSGRNQTKLDNALASIKRKIPDADILSTCVDLSSYEEIKKLVKNWKGSLDVLINNAALTPRNKQTNSEGLEMQFVVNILSYFRLTKLFIPILLQSKSPRIVNVASYWAGDLDLSDLQFENRSYNNNTAYRQSKQANRMLSTAFARRNPGIVINACHPGEVNSKLSNDLGFAGHESPQLGADTPVWLATSNEVEGKSGLYFEYRKQRVCHFSKDVQAMDKLYAICEGYS